MGRTRDGMWSVRTMPACLAVLALILTCRVYSGPRDRRRDLSFLPRDQLAPSLLSRSPRPTLPSSPPTTTPGSLSTFSSYTPIFPRDIDSGHPSTRCRLPIGDTMATAPPPNHDPSLAPTGAPAPPQPPPGSQAPPGMPGDAAMPNAFGNLASEQVMAILSKIPGFGNMRVRASPPVPPIARRPAGSGVCARPRGRCAHTRPHVIVVDSHVRVAAIWH